jgi:4-hydroxy-3-methylbut-2-enyl diphosphate reductase
MKVIVAKTAGFCWGVRRAMDAVLEASARSHHGAIQTLGPLIHNPQALDLINRRGVAVAESPAAVKDGTVVVRAHGIPIQDLRGLKERQRRGELTLVNATCPEVAKVHSKIKKWSPKGYFVVILGTHGHAESVAHQSFAEHGSAIVANLEEARALPDSALEKVLVVAQTTFTVKDFQAISEHIRARSGSCILENTICEDTWTRQAEAEEIARTVDYVVVVGGKASSNTKHLAELARRFGKPVQYVETASELDLASFQGVDTVGVMAGASTPTWLVEEVVDVLEQLGGGTRRLTRALNEALAGPLKLAVGTGFLTLGICHWTGLPLSWRYPAITALYALAMYLLTPFLDPLGLDSKGPGRARVLERNKRLMTSLAFGALLVAFSLAATLGIGSVLVVGGASLFGLAYKRQLKLGATVLSLKSIPGSKDVLVALALGVVALALPLWHDGRPWDARAWAGVLMVAALALARTTTYNLRDMHNDQILGRETLPILMGRRAAKALLVACLALALAATMLVDFMQPAGHPWMTALILAICLTYPAFHLWFFQERFSAGKSRMEPWVETGFYLAGLLAIV